MNTKQALEELAKHLQKHHKFYFDPDFQEELVQLLADLTGHEHKFFALLEKQFAFVASLNRQVNLADSNEILKHGDNPPIYSLHLQQNNFNIRFLMCFSEEGIPCFLCAFYERSGKRKTDYTKRAETAKERFLRRK
ncbi:hypothetical protein D3Z48_15135, partial [Clostridiaceae bacterium]|nr:hypothetical protein [Clostridiaceae bacterium]